MIYCVTTIHAVMRSLINNTIIFLLFISFDTAEDWRCDQYRWFQNGMKYIPKNKPTMKKYYFNTVTSNGPSKDFQRLAFQLLTDSSVMLIQYIGDSSVAEDFPHGNSHTTKPYIRVCPSVINTF
jgi:hypothetical protein